MKPLLQTENIDSKDSILKNVFNIRDTVFMHAIGTIINVKRFLFSNIDFTTALSLGDQSTPIVSTKVHEKGLSFLPEIGSGKEWSK